MNLAVLIPFHAGPDQLGRHRQAVWDVLRPWWLTTGHTLIVGSDPGVTFGRPFSVARALNNAARHAPEDVDAFALFGADHVPDLAVLAYAERQLESFAWTRLYNRISYLDAPQTGAVLAGTLPLKNVVWPSGTHAPCPGVLAVHRGRWDAVGGMGEQYEGWGYEDTDLLRRLEVMSYGGIPQTRPLRELWHDTSHRDMTDRNPNLARYQAIWRHL